MKRKINWNLNFFLLDLELTDLTKLNESLINERIKIKNYYNEKIKIKNVLLDEIIVLFEKIDVYYVQLLHLRNLLRLEYLKDKPNTFLIDLKNITIINLNEFQIFFNLIKIELSSILNNKYKEFIFDDNNKTKYNYILKKLIIYSPHILPINEEKLIFENELKNSFMFMNNYQSMIDTILISGIDGKKPNVSFFDTLKFYKNASNKVQKTTYTKMYNALEESKNYFANLIQNIYFESLIMSKKRRFSEPIEPILLQNDISHKIFFNVLKCVQENIHLYEEFLTFKSKLLGIDKSQSELFSTSLINEKYQKITWKKAKKISLDIYTKFDDQFGLLINKIFNEDRVYVISDKRKEKSALCIPDFINNSAFIYLNFNKSMIGVRSLIHELGHALQYTQVLTHCSYLNSIIAKCLMEVPSEFSAMLFIEYIITNFASSDKYIVFNHLQYLLNQIFNNFFNISFEMDIFNIIKKEEILNADKIIELFLKSRQFYIEWIPVRKYDWILNKEFFGINDRFASFSNTFAYLLSLVLFWQYKKEEKRFNYNYKQFLSSMSSKSPLYLCKECFDLNIEDETVWNCAFSEINNLFTFVKQNFVIFSNS